MYKTHSDAIVVLDFHSIAIELTSMALQLCHSFVQCYLFYFYYGIAWRYYDSLKMLGQTMDTVTVL